MRSLAASLALLIPVSCSSPPSIPWCGYGITDLKFQKLIPLIKSEKFDEAAALNVDLLARAFVKALREMKTESADARRIVRIANFFFDHYPFCIKDLPIEETVFEAMVEMHFEANLKLTSPIPSCRQLEACETLDDLIDLLEVWHDEHADGDRCARRILDITRDARREGLGVTFAKYRVRDSTPWHGDNYLANLLRKGAYAFGNSPYLPLISCQIARLDGNTHQRRRHEAWCDRWDLTAGGRWKRLFHARLLWLGALRQEPKVYEGGYGSLLASKFDPRLGEIGRALDAFREFMMLRDSRPKSPASILPAARALVRAGHGTPFADVARLGGVIYSQDVGLEDEAASWFREQRKEFDQPLRAAYALLYMADPRSSDRTAEQRIQFAREAYELDPRGTSAISALALWGELLHAEEHDAEAIARLESAIAMGKPPLGYFEDEDADFARSEAGRLLAEMRLEREEWAKAFEAVRDWDSYKTCATDGGEYAWRNDSMAECLEHLGRVRDAGPYRFKAACSRRPMSRETAEELLARFKRNSFLKDLRDLVAQQLAGMRSVGNELCPEDGLKWLADELSIPLK